MSWWLSPSPVQRHVWPDRRLSPSPRLCRLRRSLISDGLERNEAQDVAESEARPLRFMGGFGLRGELPIDHRGSKA